MNNETAGGAEHSDFASFLNSMNVGRDVRPWVKISALFAIGYALVVGAVVFR